MALAWTLPAVLPLVAALSPKKGSIPVGLPRALCRMRSGPTERLDRLVAVCGGMSRKAASSAIHAGRVLLDGVVCTDGKRRAGRGAHTIHVDDDELDVSPVPLLLAYHKPVGVHCTMRDNLGRSDLAGVVPHHWSSELHAVGRLDADTSGLLLFSSNGQLTQRCADRRGSECPAHPSRHGFLVQASASQARCGEGV